MISVIGSSSGRVGQNREIQKKAQFSLPAAVCIHCLVEAVLKVWENFSKRWDPQTYTSTIVVHQTAPSLGGM